MAALIADSFAWFKALVKERRGLTDDELANVDDGRVFTGRQGLPLKLADAIGGEREAIAWLEKERGVAKDLPVRDYKPGRARRLQADEPGRRRGRPRRPASIAEALRYEDRPPVDGLVSVWQLSGGD